MHSTTKSRVISAAAASAALALALGGCAAADQGGGQAAKSEDGLDLVTLRHSWVPDQITLPYAAAKALGFYEEEGIQLVDQPGNGGATAVQLVANGEVMFGTGEASHLLSAQTKGIDMVSVMQQYQENPNAVIALKDSGIETWEDLRGKSIGGSVTSSGHLATLAALQLAGIDKNEIDFINLSPGAQFAALSEGQVDAAGTFLGNLAGLPDLKDEVNILTVSDAGYITPSTVLFTTPELIEKDPDLVERFVRASLKGLKAALEDPKGTAEAMAGMYANVNAESLAATFEMDSRFLATEWTDENGLGLHNEEAWALQAEMLTTLGELPETDPTKNYTNEFVEKVDLADREFIRE
ncbi:ABC transporter substrate-binding protein [Microbacterium sp.]|uniref:ABC transporter substrate-binding protein n=1 Tax=Microbacterium sp. TaxID=51671 RepID=UPI0028118E9E|nr:ABC transporter substrate-binding protein [Microbacterium sp.]